MALCMHSSDALYQALTAVRAVAAVTVNRTFTRRTGLFIRVLYYKYRIRIDFGIPIGGSVFARLLAHFIYRAAVRAGDKIALAKAEKRNEEQRKLLKGACERNHAAMLAAAG